LSGPPSEAIRLRRGGGRVNRLGCAQAGANVICVLLLQFSKITPDVRAAHGRGTMALFYSWREKKRGNSVNPDFEKWKEQKFAYTWDGKPSNKAFWVFKETSDYKPASNIVNDRVLVAFDFGAMAETVIELPENHIDFESEEFLGEAKHPTMVIVKNNEPGAYGIGALIRGFLTVTTIRLATPAEVNKALGFKANAPRPLQKW
jgi:hypothetical protein